MSGYVNLVVRHDGVVQKGMVHTSVIAKMFNPALYDGNVDAVDGLIHVDPEFDDGGEDLLAPREYGLIVFDLDQKTVWDMQPARSIHTAGVSDLTDRASQYFEELGRRGWLGRGLCESAAGEMVIPFPEGVFESRQKLFQWLLEIAEIELLRPLPEPFKMSDCRMLSMRLDPPGWGFQSFERTAGGEMRDALARAEFTFTESESQAWQEWHEAYPADAEEPDTPITSDEAAAKGTN